MKLPISSIHPNPDQPRKRFDQEALTELADSIRELGVLQPIAVRDEGGGTYLLIAGERRWRAAQEAGLDEIPVVVLEGQDDEILFVRSVAENVNRADMTIVEEVDAYARLADLGYTAERIGKLLGKSPHIITWKLGMRTLDPGVRAVAATGQLPADLVWHLAQLGETRQREVVRKWGNGDFESQKAAQAYCEAVQLADSQEVIFAIEEIPVVTKRQERARRQTSSKLESIGRAMVLLEEIFEKDDQEMAVDLGPDAARLREQLDGLHRMIGRLKTRAVKVEQMVNAGVGQSQLLP